MSANQVISPEYYSNNAPGRAFGVNPMCTILKKH